jgi:hypothetical protein
VAFFGLAHLFLAYFTGFQAIPSLLELVRVNSVYYETHIAPYWYLKNIGDLVIGLGYASVVALLYCVYKKPKLPLLTQLYAVVFVFNLLILDFLGVTRAEAMRLWIFYGCLIFPLLGVLFARVSDPKIFRWVMSLNLVQTLVSNYVIGFVWWP